MNSTRTAPRTHARPAWPAPTPHARRNGGDRLGASNDQYFAIVLCEDDASSVDEDPHPLAPGLTNVNRLIGLAPGGQPFEFAVNVSDDSEFAGACFSPDKSVMFVNTLGSTTELDPPGRTYAIRGPWQRGPLWAVSTARSTARS